MIGECVLRFLRHVPVIYVDYPGSLSLKQIYGTFNRAMLRLVPNLRTYSEPLTDAMVDFYTISQVLNAAVRVGLNLGTLLKIELNNRAQCKGFRL